MPPRPLFYICRFFPRPTGATYSAIRLAGGLRDRGVEVAFIVDDADPAWRGGGRHDGFPVRSFPLQSPGKLRKLAALLRFTLHLAARRRDIDLFHIHGGGHVNLFLAGWVRHVLGKPVLLKITSDGWDTPDGQRAGKWGALLLNLYRRLDGVVAMTSGQAETCRRWGVRGRLAVIPNGVDTTRYRPAAPAEKAGRREELGLPADAFVLCYVGWLSTIKGTDVLVEAWRRLRAGGVPAVLLLVGDYLAARGEKRAGQEDVPADPAIHRAGRTEEVERYLQAADVFVFPSRREGFGTVQIEAMACGLPCVVNDLPGVSADIFPDEQCGFRVSGNNVDEFVRHLGRLYADPALRQAMGRAGRERAERHFSMASVADRYLALYRELLGGEGPRP